jgi:uridylate kinase
VGGGNFLRGARFAESSASNRSTADYMGMLGTVLNALALQDTSKASATDARASRAPWRSPASASRSIATAASEHFEKGRVVILAAGTGNPHVTTDSCAAIRAIELKADAILKGTKVDGVYDSDPKQNPAAKRYDTVTYADVINNRLRVMDIGAAEMCEQHHIPVIVFNLFEPGTLRRVVLGEPLGTRMGPAS